MRDGWRLTGAGNGRRRGVYQRVRGVKIPDSHRVGMLRLCCCGRGSEHCSHQRDDDRKHECAACSLVLSWSHDASSSNVPRNRSYAVVLAPRQMTVQFAGIVRVNNSTKVVYQSYIDGPASGTLVRSPLWVADDLLSRAWDLGGDDLRIRRRAAVAGRRSRWVLKLRPWSFPACRGVRPRPRLRPLLIGQYPSRDLDRRVPATPPARRRHAANSRRTARA